MQYVAKARGHLARAKLIAIAIFMTVSQWLVFGVLIPNTASADTSRLSLLYENGTVPIAGFPSDIKNINATHSNLVVVSEEGKVYVRAQTDALPHEITGLTNVDKAYVDYDAGIALKNDGTVWSWGRGSVLGRINDPDATGVNQDSEAPGQINGLPQIVDIQLQYMLVVALDVNGHVWTWGSNSVGQLGTNSACRVEDGIYCNQFLRVLPMQVQGLEGVTSIATTPTGVAAVLTDGGLRSWGSVCEIETNWPRLFVPTATPVLEAPTKQVVATRCGFDAVLADGSVYTWGIAGMYPSVSGPKQLFIPSDKIVSLYSDGDSNVIARDINNGLYRTSGGGLSYVDADGNLQTLVEPTPWPGPVFIGTVAPSTQVVSAFGAAIVLDYVPPITTTERIYYLDGYGRAVNVSPNGADHAVVLAGANTYLISPNRAKTAYISGTDGHLYVTDISGANVIDMGVDAVPSVGINMAWTADSGRLLYSSLNSNNNYDVYSVKADGTDRTLLYQDTTGFSLAPNDRLLAVLYQDPDDGILGIKIIDLTDGSTLATFRDDTGLIYSVAWSPDGSKLAWSSEDRDNSTHWKIVVSGWDGTNRKVIESTYAYVGDQTTTLSSPVWSPDGAKVAFSYIRAAGSALKIVDVDSGSFRLVHNDASAVFQWLDGIQAPTDQTPPQISSTIAPSSNAQGWNNSSVLLSWSVSDPDSVVSDEQGCGQSTVSWETSGTTYECRATSAGGTTTKSVTVKTDFTAPVLTSAAWSANPKTTAGSTTLTVPATDNLSGVARAEYFLGDTDPGQGNGATMTLANAQNGGMSADLTTTFGADFQPGVYKVNVRAQDVAGNWSDLTSDYLVVYDPSGPNATGGKQTRPSLGLGDVLPGLTSSTQTDTANFGLTIKHTTAGAIDAQKSDFQFDYKVGKCNGAKQTNCVSSLELNATSIDWLVTDGQNLSHSTFQGSATLKINGVTTTNPYRVELIDGGRTSPTQTDHFVLKIYTPGANPSTATPLYQVNDPVTKGKVTIG